MIGTIVTWLAAIIFVEATVEIEVNSGIFQGFRARIIKIPWVGWYLHGLFSCGYCLSVWVAAATALFVPGDVVSWIASATLGKLTNNEIPFAIADYLFKIFVIHRLANIWHEGVYRWLARMPFILGLKPIEFDSETMELDNGEEQDTGDSGQDSPE